MGAKQQSETQEGRLRAGQRSQIAGSLPSDGRLRQAEGTRPQQQEMLSSNLTRQTRNKDSPAVKFPEFRPVRPVSPANPFGSHDSSAELDENNPFAESKGRNTIVAKSEAPKTTGPSNNPFGSPEPSPVKTAGGGGGAEPENPFGSPADNNPFADDYNDELNPFS